MTGDRKAPLKRLVLRWIKETWTRVAPDTIRGGFKKCAISNKLDWSEDDLLLAEDDDESDVEFEEFSETEVQLAEDALDNQRSIVLTDSNDGTDASLEISDED